MIQRSIVSENPSTLRPLLIASTDIRTPKVAQLTSSGSVSEIAWWIEDAGEQYRITAKTYILPTKDHALHAAFPADLLGPDTEDDKVAWWERERVDTFNNKMGGVLRASFVRPTPGSPLPGGYEAGKEWPETLPRSTEAAPGSKEAELVAEALNNFSLVVFQPSKVELVQLSIVRDIPRSIGSSWAPEVQDTEGRPDRVWIFTGAQPPHELGMESSEGELGGADFGPLRTMMASRVNEDLLKSLFS